MTVSNENNKTYTVGNGSTTAFPFNNVLFADTALTVVLVDNSVTPSTDTPQTLGVDYTVAIAGDNSSATVNMTVAPAATETLVIYRNQPDTQTTSYPEGGEFPAASHEDALDRGALQSQTQEELITRSLKLPATQQTTGGNAFDGTMNKPTELVTEIRWNATDLKFEMVNGITDLDAIGTVDTDDSIMFSDTSDSGKLKQGTVADLMISAGSGDVIGPGSSTDNAFPRFNGTSGKALQNSQTTEDDSGNVTVVGEITVKTLEMSKSLLNKMSTGVTNGAGCLTINAGDNTKFDVQDGFGYIVDHYSDAENPTFTLVTWSGLTAQTPVGIGSDPASYVAINSSGTLVQQTTPYGFDDQRDLLVLGALVHGGATITNVADFSKSVADGFLSLDMAEVLGVINIFGNNFNPASTDLTIRREAGQSFDHQINRCNDLRDPHRKSTPVVSPLTFIYAYDDGTGDNTLVFGQTDIDPDQYDDGSGTLQTVSNNRWTVQQVYFFPSSELVIVRYGTEEFSSLADAEEAAFNVPDTIGQLTPEFVRTVICVEKGETDLTSANTAFFDTGRFGLGSGGGSAGGGTFQDLQDSYNNSANGEIITDNTRGAFKVQRGSGADTDRVLTVENGANTVVFSVTGEGKIPDNELRIAGNADATKVVEFDVDANVTTATTRTKTFQDTDGTLAEQIDTSRAPDVILQDQKSSGTNGGSSSSGVNTRVLNTEVRDVNSDCSLSANRFTLTAGDWYVEATAPAYDSNRHQTYLYNFTDSTNVLIGTSEQSGSGDDTQTRSCVCGVFTIAASKEIELRQYYQSALASLGLGLASSAGLGEVYAEVRLWRLS